MLLAKNLKSKENEAERCKQRSKGVIAGRRILVAWFCVLTSWLRLIGRSAGRRSCKANFGRAVDRRAHQNTRTQSERQSDINNAITNTTVTPYRGTSGRPYWPESFSRAYIYFSPACLPPLHSPTHFTLLAHMRPTDPPPRFPTAQPRTKYRFRSDPCMGACEVL